MHPMSDFPVTVSVRTNVDEVCVHLRSEHLQQHILQPCYEHFSSVHTTEKSSAPFISEMPHDRKLERCLDR